MKVNDWSSLDLPVQRELSEKDRKFLEWLEEYFKDGTEDQYGWTRQVARLWLKGLDVSEIAERAGCSKVTVRRKQMIVVELRAEFDRDYWWTR